MPDRVVADASSASRKDPSMNRKIVPFKTLSLIVGTERY